MSRRVLTSVALLALTALIGWSMVPTEAPAPPPRQARARPTPRPRPAPKPLAPRPSAPAPQPPEAGEVRCTLDLPSPTRTAQVVDDHTRARQQVDLIGDQLVFSAEPEGRGMLLLEGYAPVEMRWEDSRCTLAFEPALKSSFVYGTVSGAEGMPPGSVYVSGCGRMMVPVDEAGSFTIDATAGTCTLQAWRQFGALKLPGQGIEVSLDDYGEVDVQLDLPDFEPAGLGIQIRRHGDGILVDRAFAGTPSAELGLGHGDVILEVDGTLTEDMTVEDFIQIAIGPEGTEVDLVVRPAGGGAIERHRVARQAIILD